MPVNENLRRHFLNVGDPDSGAVSYTVIIIAVCKWFPSPETTVITAILNLTF